MFIKELLADVIIPAVRAAYAEIFSLSNCKVRDVGQDTHNNVLSGDNLKLQDSSIRIKSGIFSGCRTINTFVIVSK